MLQRKPWIVLAGVIALAFGLSTYILWRSATEPTSVNIERPGLDWARVLNRIPNEGFERSSGPVHPDLPKDHGTHPASKMESWTLSVSLRRADGERLGIQLALQRVGLIPPNVPLASSSDWATRSVYRAHLTLMGEAPDQTVSEERFSRAVLGLAGHDAEKQRIWLENWSLSYGQGEQSEQLRLDAHLEETTIALTLTPEKPPVTLDGSVATASPSRGFALTRLVADGDIQTPSGQYAVSGHAWLDHLWGELPLPGGAVGWDRLQLQLDDGSELSLLRLRRRDGRGEPTVRGYRVDGRSNVEPYEGTAIEMVPRQAVRRESGGADYPLHWHVSLPGLVLSVRPLVTDQLHQFTVSIWSGPVLVQSQSSSHRIAGTGFLEVTGYEELR